MNWLISQVTFTTYSSSTARHDNSGLPVTTCLKILGWEWVSHNTASPTALPTSGTLYHATSLATWMLLQAFSRRNWKCFITPSRIHSFTWTKPSFCDFVIQLPSTWRFKNCIIIIIMTYVTQPQIVKFWWNLARWCIMSLVIKPRMTGVTSSGLK